MNEEQIRMLILELKDMCDKQMNRDGVQPSHRVGVYDQFDIKLKELERFGNNMKCSDDCIHYGKKHPCIFCIRDPNNKDYFEAQYLKGQNNEMH
jgi:hypothetical protein